MAKLAEATLQEFCQQAYFELKGLWPSLWFDELKFTPTDPSGRVGNWIWFCGNVYLGATDFRYVCFVELNYDQTGKVVSLMPYLSFFPHNSYLDLAFIRLMTSKLKQNPADNLFHRDHPPPTWLMKE